ncbi:hypothetical protein F5Y15DRAFT_229731 [Xylariaceae sp. FL0016]|nr:hypothetical protein F5Y15DRAFT_229731 [Xylariaceae sp. FL0016]
MAPPVPRKSPWEYSTNKHTLRVRKRQNRLSDFQRALEQSKASDSKAVSRAWKIRAKTETFKNATEAERRAMLNEVEKEVNERRRERGIDYESKMNFFKQRSKQSVKPPSGPIPDMAPPNYQAAHTVTSQEGEDQMQEMAAKIEALEREVIKHKDKITALKKANHNLKEEKEKLQSRNMIDLTAVTD